MPPRRPSCRPSVTARARLALAAALAACTSSSPDPAPPLECPTGAAPAVALGFGPEGTTALPRDAAAEQIFGPQGLSHIIVGVRTTGIGTPLELRFEARDAFTGGSLGAVRRTTATVARFPDTAAGSCEARAVLLPFNGLFAGGGGLAEVRVTATDRDGRSATDAQRVWIGRVLASCVPGEGTTPAITPLSLAHPTARREDASALRDDDTLVPVSAGDALLGVAAVGFAASAITLAVTLAEDTPGGRRVVRELRATPLTGDVTVVPVPRRAGVGCVAPATVRLPIDAAVAGRPLVLEIRADDGLGHSVRLERRVVLAVG